MPWPKGKPRKGHVNKDGTPHAAKGSKLVRVEVVKVDFDPFKDKTTRRQRKREEAVEQGIDLHHGYVGNRAVTEVCPNCFYVYADGGYCPECHWSAPVEREPWDSNRGKVRA